MKEYKIIIWSCLVLTTQVEAMYRNFPLLGWIWFIVTCIMYYWFPCNRKQNHEWYLIEDAIAYQCLIHYYNCLINLVIQYNYNTLCVCVCRFVSMHVWTCDKERKWNYICYEFYTEGRWEQEFTLHAFGVFIFSFNNNSRPTYLIVMIYHYFCTQFLP